MQPFLHHLELLSSYTVASRRRQWHRWQKLGEIPIIIHAEAFLDVLKDDGYTIGMWELEDATTDA